MGSLAQGIFERAFEEGFEKGKKKAQKEISIRLHKMGFCVGDILAVTGASEEELNEWLGLAQTTASE